MSRPTVPQRSSSAGRSSLSPFTRQQEISTDSQSGRREVLDGDEPPTGAAPAQRHTPGAAFVGTGYSKESHESLVSEPAGSSAVSHRSSASSLRARASARGGVHMLPSSVGASETHGSHFSPPSAGALQEQRVVSAQRGTARPAAFVHESPRLRRKSNESSRSVSHTGPAGRVRGFDSGGGNGHPPAPGSHGHSFAANGESLSRTGSFASSQAGTLDLPFGTVSASRPPRSSWALGSLTRQQGRAQHESPHAQLSRMSMVYPQTRVLPFGEQLRILVTGGAGFVGSHLVDRLMMEGHEVIVMDNFFTGSKNNLATWTGHPNFELLRHDVVNPLLVEVDQIYHLACPASPKDYQRNEVKTLKTCFQGTLNMLGLAKRTRARFLLASTSEVYGDPQVHPQREDYYGNVNPTGWRACYDEGKRVAETLTYAYHQDGVDVRVARIFNTYGPNLSAQDGRVVSNFLLQALKGQPLTVFGDGQQTRSFMFIADLIDGLIALMNRDSRTGPASGRAAAAAAVDVHSPVNLGNPNEFTVRELVEVVSEVVQTLRRTRRRERTARQGSGEIEGVPERRLTTTTVSATADILADRLQALEPPDGAGAEAMETPLAEQPPSLADATPLVHPSRGRSLPDDADASRHLNNDDEDEDEDEDVQVEYRPLPSDDPRMRCPEITRARELLGWEPRWSLREGLMQTALYFERLLQDGLI